MVGSPRSPETAGRAGHGMAALTKPLFPLANSVVTVFAARFIDRIGKGIRGAPRDALVADLTPPEQLWVIAQAVEENGGPRDYVLGLRHLAERLEGMHWWLQEPFEASHGQRGPRDLSGQSYRLAWRSGWRSGWRFTWSFARILAWILDPIQRPY